jgi:hypothetical protein
VTMEIEPGLMTPAHMPAAVRTQPLWTFAPIGLVLMIGMTIFALRRLGSVV